MPRIPLYNQGQGSAVRLEAGQLSRRADVGAFTAPGRAMASLASQVGQIANQFGMAEKQKQVDDKDLELSDEINRKLKEIENDIQLDSAGAAKGEVTKYRDELFNRIDGLDMTRNQKRALKNSAFKSISVLGLNAEQKAFARGLGNSAEKAATLYDQKLDLFNSMTPGDARAPIILEELKGIREKAKANGYLHLLPPGYQSEEGTADIISGRATTALLARDDLSIEQIEAGIESLDSQFTAGDISPETYRANKNLLENQIDYLKTDVKSQAQDDEKAAVSAIILTGDAQGFDERAIKGYRLAGDESAANNAEINLGAAESAYQFSRNVAFDTPAEIEQKMQFQSDAARELAKTDPIRAEANLKATTDAMATRRESIQKDPANYVIRAFKEMYNTEPTRKQILEKQRQMGIADENISLLTGTEVQEISGQIAQAETPAEITEILSAAAGTGETASFIMKQLNASGLSLAINYVGNKPDSPLASKLLQSARPEAITITRPAGKYQQLGGFVRNNEIVKSHLKSISGGSYADFSDNSIVGAATDTSSQNKVRQDHIKMIQEFALFLIQEDSKQLTGPDGVSISDEEMKSYVDQAAQVISERYTYIESFPNPQTSLRLPKQYEHPQIIKSISAALSNEAQNLFEKDIFFENNTYSEEDREFGMLKKVYYENVKSGYGWIMGADGRTAFMVDNAGGLVFRKGLDGGPVPVSMDIEIAAQFTPTKKPDVTITAEDVEAF